ncbi:type II toxin-antitoxin system Phd/YefM family antitoxin [Xylanibacillus composti]|uniref:Antitoxin n=1 Tax=Xylanibacillus composti TaxID=1572762 RepID=A0A8J4M2B5_9BACL|nr:type II toxin-antitoxin system Phd/YefM family antitoxin [Xylanibacillus composti]MDT9723601.1 type II toxin-antitoxin system Phd/YefM family antitoxin [Xylanibacillus composti]GIQ68361.1 antitoxin [Xylanibacillus composti]
MPQIRPVSDLRNNFADISKVVHETAEPVFLTKNGYGDMVVMSIEAYEKMQLDVTVYEKLKQAAVEAQTTDVRHDFDEVASEMRSKLLEKL